MLHISSLISFWKLIIASPELLLYVLWNVIGRILGDVCGSDIVSESLESLIKNKVREQLRKPVYGNDNKITENMSTKRANSFSQGSTVEGLRIAQDELGMHWVSTFNLTCMVTDNLVFGCHISQGVSKSLSLNVVIFYGQLQPTNSSNSIFFLRGCSIFMTFVQLYNG